MDRALIYGKDIFMIYKHNKNHIKALQKLGYAVDVLCSLKNENIPNEELERFTTFIKEMNVTVIELKEPEKKRHFLYKYKQIKRCIRDNEYKIIHTQSFAGSILVRLVAEKSRKVNHTKVIYTAYGFLFYEDSPYRKWILYYPIEFLLAFITDTLITVTNEDYTFARKALFPKKVEYVPGVGIDIEKYQDVEVDRKELRKQLQIPTNALLAISVGELNQNKNHKVPLRAIEGYDIYYLIVGEGKKRKALEKLADKVGMTRMTRFLGYQNEEELRKLYAISDFFLFPSFREGLSLSLMEAMASGLPCVVSNIRGNTDLIERRGGRKFNPYSEFSCRGAVVDIMLKDLDSMGRCNRYHIKEYTDDVVLARLEDIFGKYKDEE